MVLPVCLRGDRRKLEERFVVFFFLFLSNELGVIFLGFEFFLDVELRGGISDLIFFDAISCFKNHIDQRYSIINILYRLSFETSLV